MTIGQPFPAFALLDQDGRTWTNSDLLGSASVVYFYPKDDTSGCTIEACEFRDILPEFKNIKVFGVSPDSTRSHQKFVNKYDLSFTLLADDEKKLCQACDVWVEKSMYGRTYMGVARTTVLVDNEGVITRIWSNVRPAGHAAEVMHAASLLR